MSFHSASISARVASRPTAPGFAFRRNGRARAIDIGSIRLPTPIVTKPFTSRYMKFTTPSNGSLNARNRDPTLDRIRSPRVGHDCRAVGPTQLIGTFLETTAVEATSRPAVDIATSPVLIPQRYHL